MSTTASLSYFVPPANGEKAWQFINADTTGQRPNNFERELHDVHIADLRGNEHTVSLDANGFQYFRRPAAHKAFLSDAEIRAEYYPESERLLKDLTGASRVVFFDHTIRRRRPEEKEDTPEKRQPVPQVHVDQTTASAIARVHRHLPAEDAPRLLEGRFQIINLWRPIAHAAWDWPLTLCDFRSIDREADLVPVTLKYPDRDGETFGVKYNANHRWNYVKGMTPDEGVLIKCFDSVQDGSVAVMTPHTAFADPTTPPDAPLRESIELRALVFYD